VVRLLQRVRSWPERLREPRAARADWSSTGRGAARPSAKTRVRLLNSPHNPTGKVFTREGRALAGLCGIRTICVTDEVCEHPLRRTPPPADGDSCRLRASARSRSPPSARRFADGLEDRWAAAPPELTAPACRSSVHHLRRRRPSARRGGPQAGPGPTRLRRSTSRGGTTSSAPFPHRVRRRRRRDLLRLRGLSAAQFDDDRKFARYLIEEFGVVAIPPSVFYQDGPAADLRFASCKRETLEAAVERLGALATTAEPAREARARPARPGVGRRSRNPGRARKRLRRRSQGARLALLPEMFCTDSMDAARAALGRTVRDVLERHRSRARPLIRAVASPEAGTPRPCNPRFSRPDGSGAKYAKISRSRSAAKTASIPEGTASSSPVDGLRVTPFVPTCALSCSGWRRTRPISRRRQLARNARRGIRASPARPRVENPATSPAS
jgi:hypothetical protein